MENILLSDYDVTHKLEFFLNDPNVQKQFFAFLTEKNIKNIDEILQQMDIESRGYNMSAGKWLLLYFGSKGFELCDFVSVFEKMNLQRALIHFKKPEPLQIVEVPPAQLQGYYGDNIVICCRASSFPPPEYQWYKHNTELLTQQDSQLLIKSAKLEDSGFYMCKVSKRNCNGVVCESLDTNAVEVVITLRDFSVQSNIQSLSYQSVPKPQNSEITILKHPVSCRKVPQGIEINLQCIARSECELSYQWYQNTKELKGQTSPQLTLDYLYPDPATGGKKWKYLCEVYNAFEKAISDTAIIELDDADEETTYYATEKIAFMIANDTYENLEQLKKPSVDMKDIADLLKTIGFKVRTFKNLNLRNMHATVQLFSLFLKPGSYALFFFAGHGFDSFGQTYLQPIDCSSVPNTEEAICAEFILQKIQETNTALNVLLIDSCRKFSCKSPPGKVYQAKMKNNTIFGYSTSPLYSSHECDSERNSFFVKYLKKYITEDMKIQDVLLQVQQDISSDSKLRTIVQPPSIKSSLSSFRKLCDIVQSTTFLSDGNNSSFEKLKARGSYLLDIENFEDQPDFDDNVNAFFNTYDFIFVDEE